MNAEMRNCTGRKLIKECTFPYKYVFQAKSRDRFDATFSAAAHGGVRKQVVNFNVTVTGWERNQVASDSESGLLHH